MWRGKMVIIVIILGLVAVMVAACSTPTSSAAGASGTEKTLYVGSELKDCVGAVPMKCMQVREDPNGPWTLFYSKIEGFTYEPGFTYELRVRETKVVNPPADGSSLKWTLVKLVNKVAATVAPQPSAGLSGTNWTLVSLNGKPPVAGSTVTISFGGDGRAYGTASCNRYFGGYTINGDKLTFGPIGSSMMYCDQPGVMEQEHAFTTALEKAESFKVSGGQLEITADGGQSVLVFAAA